MLPVLFDLHEDVSLYYVLGGAGLKFKPAGLDQEISGRHGDIAQYKRVNAKLIFSSIAPLVPTLDEYRSRELMKGYGSPLAFRLRSPTMLALEHIKTYLNIFRRYPDDVTPISTAKDVRSLVAGSDSRIRFLLSMEGAEPLEDVEDLELFYMLGLRSLQLTWNFDSKYAATCMSKKDYGLTGDGAELVGLCNTLGVIVDLAHASKRSVIETCEQSRLPVIVSHANCGGVFKHARNVDDEEIDAVRRTGGVVGLTFISPTISKNPSLERLADHIVYLRDNFGADAMAIGTDFFGLLDTDEPTGLESIGKIGKLWSELRTRGMSASDIQKLASENALRVITKNARRWPR
jgi:membrane dipeptidase